MPNAKDRLIVALDVDTLEEAERLVGLLRNCVGVFKVGMQLFNSVGPQILQKIHSLGGKIFLDLKLHDIPNTVAQAGEVLTRHRVFMYNVHAAGGKEMMMKAVEASAAEAQDMAIAKPVIIAVTVLTSIDQDVLTNEVGVYHSVEDQVVHWSRLAKASGMNGVVASPQEIRAIREACGEDFLIITPGVRPIWAAKNDQKRIMTPKEAIEAGASYLVVGRPITAAHDPLEAVHKILAEMEEGFQC